MLIVLVGRFVSGGLATEYATEPVARVDIPLRLFGSGRLQPVAVHMVDAGQQDGVIREIAVEDEQPVSEGDILARLDQAPLREAIEQARQLLDTRQAALGKAQAAKADIDGRLALYQRVRRQSGGSVPSNREMAAAQDTAKRASDAVDAAQVEVASARTALGEREARLASADIRSPIAGVIARRFVTVGQSIASTPGRHLFAIAEPYTRLRLEIATDRGQALRLREAHPARAIVRGRNHRGAPAGARPADPRLRRHNAGRHRAGTGEPRRGVAGWNHRDGAARSRPASRRAGRAGQRVAFRPGERRGARAGRGAWRGGLCHRQRGHAAAHPRHARRQRRTQQRSGVGHAETRHARHHRAALNRSRDAVGR
ncbi:MAG: biotin/lipoyl-binding protein [Sphingomonas sp.]|nr:biotin/lipoyl-binding protein [Sphingomonas sp.]